MGTPIGVPIFYCVPSTPRNSLATVTATLIFYRKSIIGFL